MQVFYCNGWSPHIEECNKNAKYIVLVVKSQNCLLSFDTFIYGISCVYYIIPYVLAVNPTHLLCASERQGFLFSCRVH